MWSVRTLQRLGGSALLAGVLGVSGCTNETADWYGDRDFSAEERASVEAGFTWLAEHTGRPTPTISWTLERDAEPLPHTIRRELHPGAEAAGMCDRSAIYLWPGDVPAIRSVWDPKYLPGLAAHELGHCWLGFRDDYHGDWSDVGIMGTIYPMQWSPLDAKQLDESNSR